jgi:DNA-binding NarL/FixJ family response regulator
MKKIRILIVEDSEMFSELIAKDLQEEMDVVGVVRDGKDAIEFVKEITPDIVLLDLGLREMNGEEVIRIFKKDFKHLKTIVLSQDSSPYHVANVIVDGARAYLTKDNPISELKKAIRQVHQDGYYFNEIVSQDVLANLHARKKLYYFVDDERFSNREIEVMKYFCNGLGPKQIADKLKISTYTVNFHKNNLFKKTGSGTVVSLVRYAIKNGFMRSTEPMKGVRKN